MNTKNIAKWSLMLVVTLLLTACHDMLLNPEPESVLPSDRAFNTSKDMNLGVLGIYNSLQAKVQKDYLLMEMTSDNMFAEYYATEPGLIEVEYLEVSTENNIINNFWKTSYAGIARTNAVLSNIDNPIDYSDNEKSQYMGEAKFLRALFYFDLVRIFGDVPLVTELMTVEQAEQTARTPRDQILAFIVADLVSAEENLPAPTGTVAGRASKAAAAALLSRVYVYLEEWENAQAYLAKVLNDYHYSLVPNFRHLFSLETETNSEAIYSVTFIQGTNGHALSTTFAPLQGIYGIVPNGTRVGRPSWDLNKLYEEGDQRKAVTISDYQLPANAKPGDDPIWYPYVNKYMVPHQANNSGLDIPILRLGEAILLYAETLYKLNQPEEALAQLNRIRERAFGNDDHNYTMADFHDEQSFMDLLLLERRLELAFENQRWFDLVRTERFTTELTEFEGEYNPGTGKAEIERLTVKPHMRFFPIPWEQIQLAAPGVLTQNEGYN